MFVNLVTFVLCDRKHLWNIWNRIEIYVLCSFSQLTAGKTLPPYFELGRFILKAFTAQNKWAMFCNTAKNKWTMAKISALIVKSVYFVFYRHHYHPQLKCWKLYGQSDVWFIAHKWQLEYWEHSACNSIWPIRWLICPKNYHLPPFTDEFRDTGFWSLPLRP